MWHALNLFETRLQRQKMLPDLTLDRGQRQHLVKAVRMQHLPWQLQRCGIHCFFVVTRQPLAQITHDKQVGENMFL